jgi:lipase ATG15
MLAKRKEEGARCTSAGRVTAQLLLSFLALSASPLAAAGHARSDAQLVLPIDASPIAPLIPEPPAPAEHTFVS